MESARRNVWLLACCQALLLTNAVTLIAVSSLGGLRDRREQVARDHARDALHHRRGDHRIPRLDVDEARRGAATASSPARRSA
jgi:hypothetical protein